MNTLALLKRSNIYTVQFSMTIENRAILNFAYIAVVIRTEIKQEVSIMVSFICTSVSTLQITI